VIDDEYVLTAKHCFDGIEAQTVEETKSVLENEKFYLIFGDWKTSEEKGFKVEPIEIHFRPDRFTYDGKLDMTAADLGKSFTVKSYNLNHRLYNLNYLIRISYHA